MTAIEVAPHEVKECKFCGEKITWLRGSKSGKWYPANVDYALNGGPATFKTNFHKCTKR